MGPYDYPFSLNKLPQQRMFDGDQEVISQDQSVLREGSHSMLMSGQLYTLCGNQPVMKYWCHNSAIDQNGNFLGRDEADLCSLIAICEDNTERYFSAPTGPRRSPPVWTQQIVVNIITGAITPSSTGGIIGTILANNANAGSVGEYVTAVATTPGTTLTTATVANVTSISLTAGDWDVTGVVDFLPGATTSITVLNGGISTTTAALGAQDTYCQNASAAQVPANNISFDTPTVRISIASTTTVYLVARGTFTVSTLSAFGTIRARRVR